MYHRATISHSHKVSNLLIYRNFNDECFQELSNLVIMLPRRPTDSTVVDSQLSYSQPTFSVLLNDECSRELSNRVLLYLCPGAQHTQLYHYLREISNAVSPPSSPTKICCSIVKIINISCEYCMVITVPRYYNLLSFGVHISIKAKISINISEHFWFRYLIE